MPHLLKISIAKARPIILLAFCIALVGCGGGTSSQSNTSSNVVEQLPPVVATVHDRAIPTNLHEMYLRNGCEPHRLDQSSKEVRRELSKGVAVTDEDVKKYYEAHKNDPEFQMPELVTASHILISARPLLISQQLASEKHLAGDELQRAVNEEIERRRKLAEELRRKAQAG